MNKLTGPFLKIGLLTIIGALLFFLGSQNGKHTERAEWQKKVQQHQQVIATLQVQYAKQEVAHLQTITALSNTIKKGEEDHAQTLAAINAQYAQRLQRVTQRAAAYQRQATGTSTDTSNLAEHAARLDASLEEGRRLVEEFGSTLRLRENQLKTLGAVIQADRKLFTDPTE